MKRLFSILLCVLLCISCCAGIGVAAFMDEDELPGVVVDPDLILPTRELRIVAPESWQAVYAQMEEEPFPGTSVPKLGAVYAMTIPTVVTELFLSDGNRQVSIALEASVESAAIVVKEDMTFQVRYGTFGDVTGDGKMNIGDAAKIYSHLRGSNPLTDKALLVFADATGDGRVNLGDVAKIYNHIKTIIPA